MCDEWHPVGLCRCEGTITLLMGGVLGDCAKRRMSQDIRLEYNRIRYNIMELNGMEWNLVK
jgi:hypothetical protein